MELISLARKLTQQDNKLICALPYGDFRNSSYFTDEWRTRYDAAIEACDHIFNVTGNEHETKGCFQRRNEFLVDNSGMLICYHTANTVSYAETKGSIIINIDDDFFDDEDGGFEDDFEDEEKPKRRALFSKKNQYDEDDEFFGGENDDFEESDQQNNSLRNRLFGLMNKER